jgi:hypothetical protein
VILGDGRVALASATVEDGEQRFVADAPLELTAIGDGEVARLVGDAPQGLEPGRPLLSLLIDAGALPWSTPAAPLRPG